MHLARDQTHGHTVLVTRSAFRCFFPTLNFDAMSAALCLYSTNPWIKFHIQATYRAGKHYVWCADQPDARVLDQRQMARRLAPTSNPAEIYEDLVRATKGTFDRHNSKVTQIRQTYTALTEQWEKAREITTEQKDEILYHLNRDDGENWRPLLYVIPRGTVKPERLKLVPPENRASPAPEYIIQDLLSEEFDIVELR